MTNLGTLGAFLAFYAALLLGSAELLSSTTFDTFYAEGGPIESFSIGAWLAVGAVVVLGRYRPPSKRTTAAAVLLCLAAAAREADWHVAFTTTGIFKLRFYTDAEIHLLEKVMAGAVVIVLICAGTILLRRGVRMLRNEGLQHPSGRILLVALGLLVFTQVLDRAPAIVEKNWPVQLSAATRRHAQALEEGMETAIPILFILLVVSRRRGTPTEPGSAQRDAAVPVVGVPIQTAPP